MVDWSCVEGRCVNMWARIRKDSSKIKKETEGGIVKAKERRMES